MSTERPLAGLRIGVTAERRRAELGDALARHGAEVVYGTALRVVPIEDDGELRDATRSLVADPPDVVITTTAVGLRGWLEAADTWGLGLVDALRAADILTRGPKVRGALRAAGLREVWSPASESSDEVFAHLAASYDLPTCRVAVQLHGDPLGDLIESTRLAGAQVVTLRVYRWEAPTDPQPLRDLIAAVIERRIAAVTFTSAPAAQNFLAEADALGADVGSVLGDAVACFAVGPVTAAPLLQAGIEVILPDRFRLGALVKQICDQLPQHPSAGSGHGRLR